MRKYIIIGVVVLAVSIVAALLFLLGGRQYTASIPSSSTAIVALDMKALKTDKTLASMTSFFEKMLGNADVEALGIDFSAPAYLFVAEDGTLGLCMKVGSHSDAVTLIKETLVKEGRVKYVGEKRGNHFAVIDGQWLLGLGDEALVITGPFLASDQTRRVSDLARMLDNKDDNGLEDSRFYERLNSMDAPLKMVARASALPEKVAQMMVMGVKEKCDDSQIVVAAEFNTTEKGTIDIAFDTFSFNEQINQQLRAAHEKFRVIGDGYISRASAAAQMSLLANVNGNDLADLIHTNKTLEAMLTGANTAIDMEKIIRGIDGDMLLTMPMLGLENMKLGLVAQLRDKSFLSDVDYWKKSCPKGTSLSDWKKDAFCLSTSSADFYFGVAADMQFYSGDSEVSALASMKPSVKPLTEDVKKILQGQHFAIVVNPSAVAESLRGTAAEAIVNSFVTGINMLVIHQKTQK